METSNATLKVPKLTKKQWCIIGAIAVAIIATIIIAVSCTNSGNLSGSYTWTDGNMKIVYSFKGDSYSYTKTEKSSSVVITYHGNYEIDGETIYFTKSDGTENNCYFENVGDGIYIANRLFEK